MKKAIELVESFVRVPMGATVIYTFVFYGTYMIVGFENVVIMILSLILGMLTYHLEIKKTKKEE